MGTAGGGRWSLVRRNMRACREFSGSRRAGAISPVAVLPQFPETGTGDPRQFRTELPQPAPVVPAEPAWLEDGTLYSTRYGDVYASAEGALAEAEHVFLGGNGLPHRWQRRESFAIVEIGFGAGLNFLATWAAWRAHAPAGSRLHYLSAEKHPFRTQDLARVHAPWRQVAELGEQLRERYPSLVPGFHRLRLDAGRVSLTLLFGDALDMLREVSAQADAFYLDGFAPARNPELWSAEIFAELARIARPDATAATYSVAGVVRRGLSAAGFRVERCGGFGRKKQMLAARRAKLQEPGRMPTRRHAAVIGAGLAGSSCAAQLAERGWTVDLIERHSEPAREASGNPAGLLMPAFSLDWNAPTRLTVQACSYARWWRTDLSRAVGTSVWQPQGVLQLARDAAHLERQRRICEIFALPDSLVRIVDAGEGSAIAGWPVAGAGWWLPSAGWADPREGCRATLAACDGGVRALFGRDVVRMRRAVDHWELLGRDGTPLTRAPVVVFANARDAKSIEGCEQLPLAGVRGQVSLIPEHSMRALRVAVCREGYIAPAAGGFHCLGASYNPGSEEMRETLADHADNLQRLERLLPGFGAGLEPGRLAGRVGFRSVTPDRMPLVGALHWHGEPQSGVFACLGLASRGLAWAPLLAETVACLASGEPPPLERGLLRLIAPERFASRP